MQLLLPSQYLAPVGAYAYLFAAERVVEDRGEFYIKQTYRNRCHIAGPQGVLSLIVPVERKGLARLPMCDVRISEHGNWRHVHWTALVSAYESSPYFEYYADDFRPLYETPFRYLVDFNEALHRLVCELLSFAPQERVSVCASHSRLDRPPPVTLAQAAPCLIGAFPLRGLLSGLRFALGISAQSQHCRPVV